MFKEREGRARMNGKSGSRNNRMYRHRYILSLAAMLAGCMLWGGCGMGTAGNTDAEQAVEFVGEGRIRSRQELAVMERAAGDSAGEGSTTGRGTVGVVFPVRSDPLASEAASSLKDQNTNGGESGSKEQGTGGSGTGSKQQNPNGDGSGSKEQGINGSGSAPEGTVPAAAPLLEQLFSYEIEKNHGNPYLIVTGIAEEYRDSFWENMADITGRESKYRYMLIPADVNGMPVRAIGEEAFAGMDIIRLGLPDTLTLIGDGAFRHTHVSRLELPENLEHIGAGAFEDCGLERLQFPHRLVSVGERAFAGSMDLWTVLIPNAETSLGDGAFADCREGFLLCYGDQPENQENLVAGYAEEQGLACMEIILSQEPIVNYPDQPLTLKPEIGSFFYGDYENGDDELWCSWEEAADAPNFGYIDWQAPGCSSWCGAYGFEQEAEASSELASAEDRYAAGNVLVQDRQSAWAEGAEGPGIGESLIYRQSCTYGTDNKWEAISYDNQEPLLDGFMRYSEICVVNGYAKTPKTWEENGRVKKLMMYVEGRPYACLELEDTMQPQYFKLPEDDIKVLNGGMLEVRFEILEVYPGSVYEDTCLTGLIMEFTGRYAH